MQGHMVEAPNFRWNFNLTVLNGVAFALVDTLVNRNLVLVVFLAQLTDNPVILAMPMALWTGGFMLTQIVVSGHVQRLDYALPLYKRVGIFRLLAWGALVVGTIFLRGNALLGLMLVFLVLYPLASGMSTLAFMEIVGKTIPPRLRGMVFSYRHAFGAVLAIGGGWLVNRALSDDFFLVFPLNYALLFGIGAFVALLGLAVIFAIREPAQTKHGVVSKGVAGRWHDMKHIWQHDRLFRHYVWMRIAILLAVSTTPLIIVYAGNRFALSLNAAALYLVADTITGFLVVTLSGWLSVRIGSRYLTLISLVLTLLVFCLVVMSAWIPMGSDAAFWYFLLVFVLLAAHTASKNIGLISLQLNIPPEDQRPMYIGTVNTISGAAAYISIVQGFLVVSFGYITLFVIAGGLIVFSIWQIVGWVYDPTETSPEDMRYARSE